MKRPGKNEKDNKKNVHDIEATEEKKASVASDSVEETLHDASAEEDVNAFEKELCDLKDRYMRLLAEYDNFRKRSQKEKEALYDEAITDVAKEWLPVIDNFERGLAFQEKNSDIDPAAQDNGMEKIYRQACDVLTKLGVEVIECAAGTSFDPNFHSAVAHIDDENLGEQCVAQVFLKGYRKGDRIIRHTMVQVAN